MSARAMKARPSPQVQPAQHSELDLYVIAAILTVILGAVLIGVADAWMESRDRAACADMGGVYRISPPSAYGCHVRTQP